VASTVAAGDGLRCHRGRHPRALCGDRGQRGFAGLLVVIGGGKAAHPQVEFGCEREDEEGARQRQVFGRGKGQQAQQRKAAIDRHQRDRERREEFQHRARQEGDAQHGQRAPRDIGGRRAQVRGHARLRPERQDRRQRADAVDEQARKPGQRLVLGIGGAARGRSGERHGQAERRQCYQHDAGGDQLAGAAASAISKGEMAAATQGEKRGETFCHIDRVHGEVQVLADKACALQPCRKERAVEILRTIRFSALAAICPLMRARATAKARNAPPASRSKTHTKA
jgi:hypothetical protein